MRVLRYLSLPFVFACSMFAFAHDEAIQSEGVRLADTTQVFSSDSVTGNGAYKFKTWQTSDILPEEALESLSRAHGGFAVDRREGKGHVYFALPGAGIIRIEPDLKSAVMLPTPPEMKDHNLHNCTIWYDNEGTARLVFPANDAGKVFTTTLDGELVGVLNAPTTDDDFDHPAVNTYFSEGNKFAPTDVEYLSHFYYVTTGYSPLDYVLVAAVDKDPFFSRWSDLAFAGKGNEVGQLQTGHGITVMPNGKHLSVADRPVAQIENYTRYGHYRSTVDLPEGAFPCDIDYAHGYALVPCLHGADRDKGAPIYLMKEGEVISTIMAKHELGLPKFQHIHNAVLTQRDGKLYIIAQAWNPGDFAIFEQVIE